MFFGPNVCPVARNGTNFVLIITKINYNIDMKIFNGFSELFANSETITIESIYKWFI